MRKKNQIHINLFTYFIIISTPEHTWTLTWSCLKYLWKQNFTLVFISLCLCKFFSVLFFGNNRLPWLSFIYFNNNRSTYKQYKFFYIRNITWMNWDKKSTHTSRLVSVDFYYYNNITSCSLWYSLYTSMDNRQLSCI